MPSNSSCWASSRSLVIALGMRFFERRWPLEKAGDDRLIGVDRVYTVLEQARHHSVAIFVSPIRSPTRSSIWCGRGASRRRGWNGWCRGWTTTRSPRSWSISRSTTSPPTGCIAPSTLLLVVGAAQPASQPAPGDGLDGRPQPRARRSAGDPGAGRVSRSSSASSPTTTSLILMVGRLIESWSHANVDMSFGRFGERLLVGPRFHRLHHALAEPRRAAYPRPQFRAGLPDLGHAFRHGDLRRQAPADRRRRPADRCRQWPRLARPAGDGVRPLRCGR